MKALFKYMGSKRTLLPLLKERMPKEYNLYCEPFLGAGNLFFDLEPEQAVVNDINPELMNFYRRVQVNVECLIRELRSYQRYSSSKRYYACRDLDLDEEKFKKMTPTKRAARFLYLVCSCFHGVIRFNAKGHFNSPFGQPNTYKYWERKFELLREASAYLHKNKRIRVLCGPYRNVFKKLSKGDFVYLDPPYDDTFTRYVGATWEAKKEYALLLAFCQNLDRKKIYWMLSNKDTPKIRNLYKDFNIFEHTVSQKVAVNGKDRKPRAELLITNY